MELDLFESNIAKCTITERDLKDPYNPYQEILDPFTGINDTFVGVDQDGDGSDGDGDGDTTPTYRVTADKSSVKEGDFVIFDITTTNLEMVLFCTTLFGLVSHKMISLEQIKWQCRN